MRFIVLALLSSGCAGIIEKVVLKRVIPAGMKVADTDEGCVLGGALAFPVLGLTKKTPWISVSLTQANAAICSEKDAWEAELSALAAQRLPVGAARYEQYTDASIKAARAHTEAAARFERAYRALEEGVGRLDEGTCPKVKPHEEIAVAVGLVSGALAMLHDRKGGGLNDVPMDRLAAVARASDCLDDDRWWGLSTALKGAAWGTIPGTGPSGVDPWELMHSASESGAKTGVRIGYAIEAKIASNAGKQEIMIEAIVNHGRSLAEQEANPDFVFFDRYAKEITRHEADKLWMMESGHRSEVFGRVPEAEVAPTGNSDDPFAPKTNEEDPFKTDPSGDEVENE